MTITAPASANIAPPGYYQVVALDSAGVPSRGFILSLGAALPAPSLIAQYPFDQSSGTSAPDASGNGKQGTLVGGASWVAGRVGSNAIRLSGSNQYVDLPDGLVSACTDFTWAGWVNLATNPNWGRVFDFGSGTATNMFLTTRAGGATLRFAIRLNNGAEQQISYGISLPLNQWRHLAVVLSGNTGRLYLDGIQVAQNTGVTLNPINLGTTTNDWLGRSQYAADPFLNGTLDDVRDLVPRLRRRGDRRAGLDVGTAATDLLVHHLLHHLPDRGVRAQRAGRPVEHRPQRGVAHQLDAHPAR